MLVIKRITVGLVVIYLGVFIYLYNGSYAIVQKWTVQLNTPNGTLVSESNILYQANNHSTILDHKNKFTTGLFGEIPYFELADGRILFFRALDRIPLPFMTFRDSSILKDSGFIGPKNSQQKIFNVMRSHKDKIYIEKNVMPGFFILDDFSQTRSIKTLSAEELPQYLGSGYSLKSVSLQTTNEKVTNDKIGKLLPWLNNYYAERREQRQLRRHKTNEFDRIDLRRFWDCAINPRLIRSLTLGLYTKGIACRRTG